MRPTLSAERDEVSLKAYFVLFLSAFLPVRTGKWDTLTFYKKRHIIIICLWGVSPIRLIHKPKAGITKKTSEMKPFLYVKYLVFLRTTLHGSIKLCISEFIRRPGWYYAPKMC